MGGVSALIEIFIVMSIANLGAALVGGSDGAVSLVFLEGVPLATAGVAATAAVGVKFLVDNLLVRFQARALYRYETEARASVLGAYISAEWSEQSSESPAQLVNTTYSFLNTARANYRRVMEMTSALASFVIMAVGSFVAGGLWVIAIIAGVVVIGLGLRPMARRAHDTGTLERDAAHAFSDAIWETVMLAREIRVLGLRDVVAARNSTCAENVAESNRRLVVVDGLVTLSYTSAIYAVVTLGMLVVSLVGLSDPARVVTILLLLYRGLGYGRAVQSLYQYIVASEPSVRALGETRDRFTDAELVRGGLEFSGELQTIALEHVDYSYGGSGAALRDVNLTIERGEALGVVGPSGAGKSTFVNLLLRLLTPSRGRVVVNGVDLNSLDVDSWFGRIVLVPQDARSFMGTVTDNVSCGRTGIDIEDVRAALRDAHVLDEMESLPDGLNTDISGDRLSGGQRQRVAIARALVGRPDVVVLDEPTSALDLLSEEAIRRTLEDLRGRVTLVIVAHRLSTLRICDRVAVFEGGRLDAVGTRSELEAGSPFYAEAVRLARLV